MTREGYTGKITPSPKISSNLSDSKKLEDSKDKIGKTERTVKEIWGVLKNGNEKPDNEDVDRLIEEGYSGPLIEYLYYRGFDIDNMGIAHKLIDSGKARILANNLDKFINHSEIANKLIDAGKAEDVLEYLNKFKNLDNTIANKLIDAGYYYNISGILNKFKNLDNTIANKLIDAGYAHSVIVDFDKFQGLNHTEIANKILKKKDTTFIAEHINFFPNIDHNEIINKLLDEGHVNAIISNIAQFKVFNNSEIFNKCIDRLPLYSIQDMKVSNFKDLDITAANKLVDSDAVQNLAQNLKIFKDLDAKIANVVLTSHYWDSILKNPDVFSVLDNITANTLIDKGEVKFVIKNIKKFKDLDAEIANKFIEEKEGEVVLQNTEKFKNLDYTGIANRLIDAGQEKILILNFDLFKEVDTSDIAHKLIDSGKARILANNLDKFHEIKLDASIANKLIDARQGVFVVQNLNKFKDLNHIEIADKLIEVGNGLDVAEHFDDFEGLKLDTMKYLSVSIINKPDSDIVYKLRDQFPLQELMSNYDKYRVKSWEQENVLETEDKEVFERLKSFIDEETLSKLWQNNTREELHIIGPQIIKMYELSTYNSDTFRGQFLERIINDGGNYNNLEGSTLQILALRYFNNIIQSLNEKTDSVLDEAISFAQTRVLAEQLKKDGPFKNWETLKKYHELSEVLKQREVLEKLQKLKDDGKDKQYKFFSDLAFHPGSKISMQTVFQFMKDPARFLDVEDAHSGETHERKKPSNYTRFNYLDISAEDLRDALIEGNLDKLQYFKPFEAGYKIADRDYSNGQIINSLKDALGSYREKIQGNAKNPGKLFQAVQGILKKHNIEYKDIVNNPNTLESEIRHELETALFDNNFGIKDSRKFDEYLVKIHPKSSPEGHLAGNDTACCMPFGSGKNNVYMYNLGCSILTVQRKVDDKYRTIAQSVLTPDVDIKHNIYDLVNQVQSETLISSVITEDLTQKKKIIITADNIEVAPNAEKYKSAIENIYSDFISRYAQEIDSNNIEKDRMLIGKGYSDLHFSRSKSIDNTFIPITPVAYSDNYGGEVYELPLTEKSEIIPLPNYGFLQEAEVEKIDPDLPKGVSYLTAHDTLRVSYMEGKVYAENESLVQYIHRIGNELTAKDINNSFKDRPNLSLKVEDDKGAMLGYMIAYEGAKKNNNYNNDEDYDNQYQNNESGEKLIYISDLAADVSRSKLAGGRLIKAFENLIKREYLDKNNPLPIIAQARENTSYKIIQNQLNSLGKSYGYKYELEENGSYESGGDMMYQIKLLPVKI